jgi:alkanesulfonate monooxygenase SsuD/methylene tetrahydromethanopterin reductase-like flavin-dependent oxidoreductase (luciferase family)
MVRAAEELGTNMIGIAEAHDHASRERRAFRAAPYALHGLAGVLRGSNSTLRLNVVRHHLPLQHPIITAKALATADC